MNTRPLEWAQNYVDLSNAHDLNRIRTLFTAEAIYYSAYFGEFKGRDAIHAMMVDFFGRFPDAHWAVPEYRDLANNGVEFSFIMTGIDRTSGNMVCRHGLERIFFSPDGLIQRIMVLKPDS